MLERRTKYATSTIILHWLIAIIVITMLSFSFFLDDLPRGMQPLAFMFHKSFGITVLALMLLRIVFILLQGRPPLPESVPFWEEALSRAVQYALYLLLLAMPFSGWLMSSYANKSPVFFGFFKVPSLVEPNKQMAMLMNSTHKTIAWMLIVLIILHIAGSIKHFLIDKDGVTEKMLPGA